jgi:hypothetical protein
VNAVTTATVANQTVCSGNNAVFSVSTTNSGPGSLSYQWKRSTDGGTTFTTISGANAASYTETAPDQTYDNYQYECLVASDACTPLTSTAGLLRVNSVTAAIVVGQTVCSGVDATFAVSVTNSGSASLSYQWKRSTDGGSTFSNISGANGTSYIVSAPGASSDNYRYEVIVTSGSCTSYISTVGTLRVNAVTAATVANETVCSGVNATFTVIPTNTGPASLSYQWQLSTDGGVTFYNINGANGTSYLISTPGSSLDNNQYDVIVNSGSCTGYVSNAGTLRVNAVTSATVAGQTVCSGTDAYFSVNVNNTGSATLSYQWKLSTDGGATFSDINGATGAFYTLLAPTASSDNFQY